MKFSEEKRNFQFNLLKELGYFLLLLVFFLGILWGSICLKNIDNTCFQQYAEQLETSFVKEQKEHAPLCAKNFFEKGLEIIAIFWVVGMSIVGVPFLVGYIGYKGYALGYTLSTIIRLLGAKEGNSFIFHYLFFHNMVFIALLLFLGNFSIKVAKNFFEKKKNLKQDACLYSILSGICGIIWIGAYFMEKIFLINF